MASHPEQMAFDDRLGPPPFQHTILLSHQWLYLLHPGLSQHRLSQRMIAVHFQRRHAGKEFRLCVTAPRNDQLDFRPPSGQGTGLVQRNNGHAPYGLQKGPTFD